MHSKIPHPGNPVETRPNDAPQVVGASDVLPDNRPEIAGPAKFTYISCWHTPENAPIVAERARSSDIVAIEAFGATQAGRREDQVIYTGMLTKEFAELPEAQKERARAHVPHSFFAGVLRAMEGSEAQVVMLDIGGDDPGYVLTPIALMRKADARSAILQDAPNSKIESLVRGAAEALGRSFIPRNQAIVEQLHDIDVNNPGSSVTVIAGLTHLRDTEALPGGDDKEVIFIDAFGDTGSEEHGQYIEDIAAQIAAGETIGDGDIKRATLQMMYDTYFTDHPPTRELKRMTPEQRIAYYRTNVIEPMSDEQVGGLLARLDTAKRPMFLAILPNLPERILRRSLAKSK